MTLEVKAALERKGEMLQTSPARAGAADESGSPIAESDVSLISNFISGKLSPGSGPEFGEVYDPSTGQVTSRVIFSTASDVDAAVAAAKHAFDAWAEVPPVRRARILHRALTLMNEHRDSLAAQITREHGKVLSDARGEVERGIDVVEFAC